MLTPEKQKALDLYNQGRRHYKLMEFDQALAFFRQALEADPKDGPSQIYVERCELYIKEPPPPDWDGVFVMKTK